MTSVQGPRCLKCGKSKSREQQSSITQWMSNCNCDLVVDQGAPTAQIITCQNCGKRVEHGRAGSITQWVFRSDLCSCEGPKLAVSELTSGSGNDSKSAVSFQKDHAPEVEMEVDSASFPLDRYMPLRLLGEGAAGSVYLCLDRLLNLKVAVKVLRYLNGEQLISFQQEARATSQLNHPNIIKVLNFGASESGAPYMVMEFFSSSSLESLIAENGALPPDVVLHICAKLCDALASAHERGIFHRDLKSSNILVSGFDTRTPDIRLIDFGVALVKRAHQESTVVQGITVVGTPKYMPPDQALGKTYDARSEVYSLGCVLFESLTGRLPFVADTAMELVSMHANEEPPWLADANENVEYSQTLESLITTCLAKDPGERFQSMGEMRDACLTAARESSNQSFASDGNESQSNERSPEITRKSGKETLVLLVSGICVVLVGIAFAIPHLMPSRFDSATVGKPVKLDLGKSVSMPGLSSTRSGLTTELSQPPQYDAESKFLVLHNSRDSVFESIPTTLPVHALELYDGEYSEKSLRDFANRPNVFIRRFLLSNVANQHAALSAVCSSPQTKLNLFEIMYSEPITDADVAALAHHSLKRFVVKATDFDGDSMIKTFDILVTSGVEELEFQDIPSAMSEEAGRYFGKFRFLKRLAIGNFKLAKNAFAELPKMKQLNEFKICGVSKLSSEHIQKLSEAPNLEILVASDRALSTEQLKVLLKAHKIRRLTLMRRQDFIGDLEVARDERIRDLEVLLPLEGSEGIVEKIKTMTKLKRLLINDSQASYFVDPLIFKSLQIALPKCKIVVL